MSPIYCQDIIDSISNQLNRLYAKFLKRDPGYDGKVSIYAHSLESVLSYDILCHQENLCALSPMDSVYVKFEDNKSQVNTTCKSVASNSTVSYDNNHVASNSDIEQLPYAIEGARSKSDVHSMVHEFNTVNSITTADMQEDCADDTTYINHEGVSQILLEDVQNNSILQLLEQNKTFGWLSMDTTEEKKYIPKSSKQLPGSTKAATKQTTKNPMSSKPQP